MLFNPNIYGRRMTQKELKKLDSEAYYLYMNPDEDEYDWAAQGGYGNPPQYPKEIKRNLDPAFREKQSKYIKEKKRKKSFWKFW